MPDQGSEGHLDQPTITDLITFEEAARLSGFTDRHLRKLAGENKIWAIKLGRNWFTTAQAVREYLAKDRKTGPKSKKPIK
jgi:excisionase family DNA binding protein